MPMYEYECTVCSYKVEQVRTVEDRNKSCQCPRCTGYLRLCVSLFSNHTFKPLELELETNKIRTYGSKRDLKKECNRLGKAMPAWDIY